MGDSAFTPGETGSAALEAIGIHMSFGGVAVLRGIDASFRAGEIHGLLGENGAGKSTLARVIAGLYRPQSGTLLLNGAPASLSNPLDARRSGIALIPQEPQVFPELSVTENIFSGRFKTRGLLRRIDWASMHESTARLLESLGTSIDPRDRIASLSLADQQLVEMASALTHPVRVLILDETTASLTPHETENLFRIVRQLKEQGVAIILISHRLEEVFSICDRVTVLRDGEKAAESRVCDTSIDQVLQWMVGREYRPSPRRKGTRAPGEPMLRIDDLSGSGFHQISLELRSGEILGLAGLVGAGRSELAQALVGITTPDSGRFQIAARGGNLAPAAFSNPGQARSAGLVYLPENRQVQGNLAQLSVRQNVTLSALGKVSRWGWIRSGSERAASHAAIQDFRIRTQGPEQVMAHLSGGNQQKVILARSLLSEPEILILDEPTRGIDLAAKMEVHAMIQAWASEGKAVLLISSDLPEVLSLSDRLAVMREGRIVAEFSSAEATPERVIHAAAGASRSATACKRSQEQTGSRLLHSFSTIRELGIVALLLAILGGALLLDPGSLSLANLRSVALWIPLLIVLSIGQFGVILSKGIDVSAGSIAAVSGIAAGLLFRNHPEFHYAWGCLLAAGCGALLGSVNGILVGYLKTPPIIATLGTLSAYRGLAFILSGGRQIDPYEIPAGLLAWSRDSVFGLAWFPALLAVPLGLALIAAYILRQTAFGRNLYALGGNPEAAFARGIPVRRAPFAAYVISGSMAGIAGIIYASRYGFVNPGTTGVGLELTAIAAVVVGGANIFGGAGKISGVLLGCLLLGTVNVMLAILGVAGSFQLAVYGAIILLAIGVDHGLQNLFNRRTRGTRA